MSSTPSTAHLGIFHDVSHLHTFDDKTVHGLSGMQTSDDKILQRLSGVQDVSANFKKNSKKLVESFTFCKNKCIFVADFALIESEIGF